MSAISVVIPTRNEAQRLPLLLADLAVQTRLPAEVIVVDAGSDDATVALAERAGATVLVHAPGVGAQRTAGGQRATGEWLVLLDADVRLAPDFLERLVGGMERHRWECACPFYWPHDGTPVIAAIYGFFNALFFLFQKCAASGAGSAIALRRSLFLALGGCDGSLTYDDIDLIRRAARRARFAMAPCVARVSARRFYRDGVLRTLGCYLLLSVYFTTGNFKAANRVPYSFGGYTEVRNG